MIGDLESTMQSGSDAKRAAILRAVTDMFIENAPRVSDAQNALFDGIFEQLTREIETEAMLELSERMAGVENAPGGLIRRLANDESIEISGPVLARSGKLGEKELLEIARTKGQAHLHALAGRADLNEQVTGVLVERGDMAVARKVASNSGARLTEDALRNLVTRASDDGDLAHAVARRRELPPAQFRALLTRATDQVRQRLLDTAKPGTANVINKILSQVSENVERQAAQKRDYADAKKTVVEMQKQGVLTVPTLMEFAKTQKREATMVALSRLAGVSIEVIDRFLDDPSDDPILILCKAIDADWPTTRAVLTAKRENGSLRESRAQEAEKKYKKLSTYSAQRVLTFWQAREKVAAAG
jgi:uncharacterized protein (DUF2336 family)